MNLNTQTKQAKSPSDFLKTLGFEVNETAKAWQRTTHSFDVEINDIDEKLMRVKTKRSSAETLSTFSSKTDLKMKISLIDLYEKNQEKFVEKILTKFAFNQNQLPQ